MGQLDKNYYWENQGTVHQEAGDTNIKMPKYVGAYVLGKAGSQLQFQFTSKPWLWHRFWMRVCFGFKWVNYGSV